MNPNQAVYMVETCVSSELRYAQEKFHDSPTADNWQSVMLLMHAWQYWKFLSTANKQTKAAEMDVLPISQWSAHLAKISLEAESRLPKPI